MHLSRCGPPRGAPEIEAPREDTRQPEEAATENSSPASGKRWLIVARGSDPGARGAPGRLLADPAELPPRAGAAAPDFSLERRGSSRTFRYGYLVSTSPQSPTPP